jgi:L-glyceraldehyde 3-phosphate reductase
VQGGSLAPELLSDEALERVRGLDAIAKDRGQTLAQLALAWTLRDARVTSTLVGASSVRQLEDNVAALERLDFSADELAEIERYAADSEINLWQGSSDV